MLLGHWIMDEVPTTCSGRLAMKRTTLIVAGLMTFGSAAAFAEGGAERMRYYYANFPVGQQEAQSKANASNNGEIWVPDDQTAQVTESYRPK